MRVIISESKLDAIILKYINNEFPVNRINYTEGFDEDGVPDDTTYVFYMGDDIDNDVFRWYDKGYWKGWDEGGLYDDTLVNYRIKQSPLLVFRDENFYDNMTAMFGEKWKPVFKKWFTDNFGLEINTIIF